LPRRPEFGRFAAERRHRCGLGKPETFNFLGFTFICGKTRTGKFQLQRKTRRASPIQLPTDFLSTRIPGSRKSRKKEAKRNAPVTTHVGAAATRMSLLKAPRLVAGTIINAFCDVKNGLLSQFRCPSPPVFSNLGCQGHHLRSLISQPRPSLAQSSIKPTDSPARSTGPDRIGDEAWCQVAVVLLDHAGVRRSSPVRRLPTPLNLSESQTG